MVNEMQTLKELQLEVEADMKIDVIDDDYCIDIINKGNLVKGYGLWLAKEIVHKDSNTGWEKFCKTVGIGKTTAKDNINFYLAKSSAIASNSLPDKEGTFRALPSGTVEEKAEFYEKVKDLTHREEPTAQDIKIVENITSRGVKDKELVKEVVLASIDESSKVKEALGKKSKKVGVNIILKTLSDDSLGEDEKVDLILGNTKKQVKPKNITDCKEMNKQLREENRKLKEENKAMKKEIDKIDYLKALTFFRGNLSRIVNGIRSEREKSEEVFTNMKPAIEDALRILKLPTVSPSSFAEIKKAYRDEARAVHPDFDGDSEEFRIVNEAYKLLKGVLDEK